MVIGGQVLNGLGVGCGFLSNPLLQEIVPKNHRPVATAFATLFSAGSFIGAPILEGLFIQKAVGGALDGWRVGFYIGAGLYLLAFISIMLFYHPMPRPNLEGRSIKQRLSREVDWLGISLVCTGLTLFLVGINFGGNPYEWTSGTVLGTLVFGVFLLVIFGLWEWKGTSTGILPHAVFQDRNFNTALLIRVSGGFALYGCQAFLPQVVVYVFGTGGLITAVWQLPLNVSTVVGALIAAIILRYFKEFRWITMGLLTVLLLGAGLMMLTKPGMHFAAWFFPSALMGIAIGSEASSLTILSGLAAPNESIATAICIGVAAGFVGGAIATTMYGQIFNSKVKEFLPPAISKAALAAGLPESSLTGMLSAFASGGLGSLPTVPGATPAVVQAVTEASRSAYAKSFQYIWYTLIAFCVVSMMGCWFFTSTTKYFTDEVTAPVVERHHKKVEHENTKGTE
ncbi:fungal trichothecene efflux pump [Dactylonectria macrodidyma]|uniref:Fungal trichothecene efflux pump n=1 Tax=Dactylonectria macrodidyma TaxID=307937 RepID=A0A9P9DMA6_9HYPO|nr:fungal trichothecene efflux pump [Dactylonectria macrodidyma]